MDLKIEIKGLNQYKKLISENQLRTLYVRTVNRVATLCKQAAAQEMSAEYNLNPGELKLGVRRATRFNLTPSITGPSRKKTVASFKPVQTPAGVSAEIKRGQQTAFPHAFIQTIKGRKQVLKRQTEQRYPVDVVRTDISVGKLLFTRRVRARINQVIKENAQRIFNEVIQNYAQRKVEK